MINTNKLRGRIVEQGMTIGNLAEAIGVSPSTLGRKIRQHNSDMTLRETEMICEILKIPSNEIVRYFFADRKED